MTRFALALALPLFLAACGGAKGADACTEACADLTEAQQTSCEESYDLCDVGGVAAATDLCQTAIMSSYELICEIAVDTEVDDTETTDTDA
jgi:hypothetical protein